ncbi:VOC family protein [Halobacillus litoralis]|uniref:VOC family protein n=1 Tax=Halobacillus litoralis TaxID=45668 RepID=UPI001CFDE8BB|nr:VOC family protein [Halobacillus litoralis]
MIEGLYEAHVPVKDLNRSIEFYKKLDLELAWKNETVAFFWIEKEKSWLGLWEGESYKTPYHPSLRHVAFRISFEKMDQALDWLKERGIEARPFGSRTSPAPFIRTYQGNASVYFDDPDGNSLELMCTVDVPETWKEREEHLSLKQWKDGV